MIYKYKKIITEGPDGTTLYAILPESGALELCEIDGNTYVFVSDDAALPEQHKEITLENVTLTDELRSEIKKSSRACQLIDMRMQAMIREKYTAEDEMYFARIGTGKALGAYEFQDGEEASLLQYGNFVESVRQWGREQRALIGL